MSNTTMTPDLEACAATLANRFTGVPQFGDLEFCRRLVQMIYAPTSAQLRDRAVRSALRA